MERRLTLLGGGAIILFISLVQLGNQLNADTRLQTFFGTALPIIGILLGLLLIGIALFRKDLSPPQ
jgi:hypothetical protein